MDQLFGILALIGIAVAVWWFFRPKYLFVIRIIDGKPVCKRGKTTEAFLHDVEDACRWSGVVSGTIYGILNSQAYGRGAHTKTRTQVKLAFSSGFPVGCQQQLRNLSLIRY